MKMQTIKSGLELKKKRKDYMKDIYSQYWLTARDKIYGFLELVEQVRDYEFDALAIHTPIEIPRDVELSYYRNGGLNPMGGVEAKCSKLIANALNVPVAHAPFDDTPQEDEEMYHIFEHEFEPRLAAEAISALHKKPTLFVQMCNLHKKYSGGGENLWIK